MIRKTQELMVTPQDLTAIEAALHTQAKILDVQAAAGREGARAQLNDVKSALASLESQKPCEKTACRSFLFGWLFRSRIFG